jgi:hypothetical protein
MTEPVTPPAPGDIAVFAHLVARDFQWIANCDDVFVANVEPDMLWAEYLVSFPEGSNPVFRKRTDHDCSCCRQFIRRAGVAVAVNDHGFHTVWDRAAKEAPGVYRAVAVRLQGLVRQAGIRDLYRVGERESSFGAPKTRVLEKETGKVQTWEHLHTGEVPRNLRVKSPDEARGTYRTTVQVFERGLRELSADAVETVVSLIESDNLYRGAEHLPAVREFHQAQQRYLALPAHAREGFAWVHAGSPAARFRNTVIGTLVQDLSEGQDVDHAVKSFETKVAPTNYKRTTAIITPGMVKKAMETIERLGLEPALERRFAVLGDVSVNDVKWVDGAVKPLMKNGLGEVLMRHAEASRPASVDEERAEDVKLDDFVATVLPGATGLEVFFRGELAGNLMSLTAPVHKEPAQLFRWKNDFAWSYGGNVADSIKERVRKAGGKVEGAVLRVSLSWYNFDDLDLHIFEPQGRGVAAAFGHIHFRQKHGWTGGNLDVDMNAGHGQTREAVENVVWSSRPPDGAYRVVVHNFTQREMNDVGFVIETESAGKLAHYSYNKAVRNQTEVHVATLYVKDGVIERVEPGDPAVTASNISQAKWGLHTEQYVRVSAVMLSPNYWGDNAVGNKHTFLVVEGAKNDEPTRGFYNEFLHPRLEEHRKVFEVIGDKTKCQPTDGQLSGLGFSSTKKESFVARVQVGKKQRLYSVRVG